MGALLSFFTKLFTSPLVDAVVGIANKYQERKISEAEFRAEVEKSTNVLLSKTLDTLLKSKRDVLLAEIHGESWLQRNWRPIVALTYALSYWYVVMVVPHLVSFGWIEPLGFGEKGLDNMFWLTIMSVGGYMSFRTVEKVMKVR